MKQLMLMVITIAMLTMASCSSDNNEDEIPDSNASTSEILQNLVLLNGINAIKTLTDSDGDGMDDIGDNCPGFNSDQSDIDEDGRGDLCDNDIDGDGFYNIADNCPATHNPDQSNICPGNCMGSPMPSTDNASLKKVTRQQLIARIMLKVSESRDLVSYNALVNNAFKATRNANNKTESWNNCSEQKSWIMNQVSAEIIDSVKHYWFSGSTFSGANARIYSNGSRILVGFSGAGSLKDLSNVFLVASRKHHDIRVMGGFLSHWESLRPGVMQAIKNAEPNNPSSSKSVHFAGHSLGGATSILAIYDYVKTTGSNSLQFPEAYTFGAPPSISGIHTCVPAFQFPPWRCEDSRIRYEKATVYAENDTKQLRYQITNYANAHSKYRLNDLAPHAGGLKNNHAGAHYTMERVGDLYVSDDAPYKNGRVNFKGPMKFETNGNITRLGVINFYEEHNPCFYARSLEYFIDGTENRWLTDNTGGTPQGKLVGKCTYENAY